MWNVCVFVPCMHETHYRLICIQSVCVCINTQRDAFAPPGLRCLIKAQRLILNTNAVIINRATELAFVSLHIRQDG